MIVVKVRERVRYVMPRDPCLLPGPPIFVMDGGAKEHLGPAQPSYCSLEKGHTGICFHVCTDDKRIIPEIPF